MSHSKTKYQRSYSRCSSSLPAPERKRRSLTAQEKQKSRQSIYLLGICCLFFVLGVVFTFVIRQKHDEADEADLKNLKARVPDQTIILQPLVPEQTPRQDHLRRGDGSSSLQGFTQVFDLHTNINAKWYSNLDNRPMPEFDTINGGVHLKKSFWGRKLLYLDVSMHTPGSTLELVHERSFKFPETPELNAQPSTGRIEILPRPGIQHQCTLEKGVSVWSTNATSVPRRTQVLLHIDAITIVSGETSFAAPRSSGQSIRWIESPPAELFQDQTFVDLAQVLKLPAAHVAMNTPLAFWGLAETPLSDPCRSHVLQAPHFNATGPFDEERSCGWPFYAGMVLSTSGPVTIHDFKVYQPLMNDRQCDPLDS